MRAAKQRLGGAGHGGDDGPAGQQRQPQRRAPCAQQQRRGRTGEYSGVRPSQEPRRGRMTREAGSGVQTHERREDRKGQGPVPLEGVVRWRGDHATQDQWREDDDGKYDGADEQQCGLHEHRRSHGHARCGGIRCGRGIASASGRVGIHDCAVSSAFGILRRCSFFPGCPALRRDYAEGYCYEEPDGT